MLTIMSFTSNTVTLFFAIRFSSASPYDPTFWIIHGTADRLVHWRRLLAHSEYVDMPLDETWGYAHNSQAASDSHLVCDWSAVDAGEAAMPTCASGECPGSNSGDMSPFSGFVEGDEETGYTNTELYAFLSPLNTDLPYVYDNFEWSHCDSQVRLHTPLHVVFREPTT